MAQRNKLQYTVTQGILMIQYGIFVWFLDNMKYIEYFLKLRIIMEIPRTPTRFLILFHRHTNIFTCSPAVSFSLSCYTVCFHWKLKKEICCCITQLLLNLTSNIFWNPTVSTLCVNTFWRIFSTIVVHPLPLPSLHLPLYLVCAPLQYLQHVE